MKMSVRRRTVIAWAAVVSAAVLGSFSLGIWLHNSLPHIQTLDPRFRIVSVLVYGGTNTPPIYYQDQSAGRIKGWLTELAGKLGLRVRSPARFPSSFLASGYNGVSVVYGGTLKQPELSAVEAYLSDNAGKPLRLRGFVSSDPNSSGAFLGTWLIEPRVQRRMPSREATPFCLQLRLANNGPELARITIRAPTH